MGLDELLEMLEGRGVDTSDTSCIQAAVSARSAQMLGCTSDTPDTSGKREVNNCRQDARKPATAGISALWRFHYPDRKPKEARFSPPVSHAEALTGEQDAIRAEPFEPICRQPNLALRERDEAKVRKWLAHIGETDGEVVAEVLDQCRTDADARKYYIHHAVSNSG
jgi:hypothetical protein